MSDRPLESWLRDALYEDAVQIIDLLQLKRPESFWRWTEYQVEVGRIDLLIAWPGAVIIVEVKRDTADENAIAQLLRYAGALEETVWCANIFKVIVARDFSAGACFASVPANVTLLKAHPTVVLTEHSDMPPSRSDLYASLNEIVCPESPVVGSGEGGPSGDDLAALMRGDANDSQSSASDRSSEGTGARDAD